ncbi:DUF2272 domain-containing protein [Bradyrhizobium sp. 23AC]
MTIAETVVEMARREWTRWGGPAEMIDGRLIGFTSERMEADAPFWTYVGEYWKTVGSHLDGRDSPAWSAAFISYCFREAGAEKTFPYNENHSLYAAAIDSGHFPGLSLQDPASTSLAVGDLVWASRRGDGCRAPPRSFTEAKSELKKIRAGRAGSFCSHSDIVVAVRAGEADVIGGNVKNAATRTTYRLDVNGCIRDGRRSFVGVIKNAL